MSSLQLIQYRNKESGEKKTYLSVLINEAAGQHQFTYTKLIGADGNVVGCGGSSWMYAVLDMSLMEECGWEVEYDTCAFSLELERHPEYIHAHFVRNPFITLDPVITIDFKFHFQAQFVEMSIDGSCILITIMAALREINLIMHRGYESILESKPSN